MGCDGGTIPRRDELVRVKKKPEQKDKDADLVAKWKHCQLTQEPLQAPIVACELGKLYNKDSVIEYLLDKSKFEGVFGFEHIRGLKDIKELQFTENRDFKDPKSDKGDVYIDRRTSRYICPITGLEMSGKYKFLYLWQCACVFSERALKEVKGDTCVKCTKPYSPEDKIILNGTEEEVDLLKERMHERRAKAKLEKKNKKKLKLAETVTAAEGSTSSDGSDGPSISKKAKLDQATNGKSSSKSNGASGKSSKAIGSTSELASSILGDKAFKSIQKDPSTSKTFKSLFTTSDAAKNRPTAHWVTYNPQYN